MDCLEYFVTVMQSQLTLATEKLQESFNKFDKKNLTEYNSYCRINPYRKTFYLTFDQKKLGVERNHFPGFTKMLIESFCHCDITNVAVASATERIFSSTQAASHKT